MASCSSCGAPIVWAKTKTGKAMPLDAKPERRFVLVDAFGGLDAEGVACSSVPTYVSHFATCPNADHHRTEKEGTKRS